LKNPKPEATTGNEVAELRQETRVLVIHQTKYFCQSKYIWKGECWSFIHDTLLTLPRVQALEGRRRTPSK
jgi:hypothetical protein